MYMHSSPCKTNDLAGNISQKRPKDIAPFDNCDSSLQYIDYLLAILSRSLKQVLDYIPSILHHLLLTASHTLEKLVMVDYTMQQFPGLMQGLVTCLLNHSR